MTYVNQLSLPNSPSEMTSIPSSACRRTTAATAVRKVAVVVCSSVSGPSARTSGGRIILPACVVRTRSVLRFIGVDRIRYRIDPGGKGTSGMQTSNGRHVTRRAFLTVFGVGTSVDGAGEPARIRGESQSEAQQRRFQGRPGQPIGRQCRR